MTDDDAKKGAANKRKPAEATKSGFIRIRVTPEQGKLMKQAATAASITLSAWAIERLMGCAKAELRAEKKLKRADEEPNEPPVGA